MTKNMPENQASPIKINADQILQKSAIIGLAIIFGAVFFSVAFFDLNRAVAVNPPSVSFSATSKSIQSGESSTLTWYVVNATSISIDQGIGTVAASGSRIVSPTATTEYKLTATGAGGVTSYTIKINVNCYIGTETYQGAPDASQDTADSVVGAFNHYQDKVYDNPPTVSTQLIWSYYDKYHRSYLDSMTLTSGGVMEVWRFVPSDLCASAPATDECHDMTGAPENVGPSDWAESWDAACQLVETGASYFNDHSYDSVCQTVTQTRQTKICPASAPTISASATPSPVNPGSAVTLTWNTSNSQSVSIDQGIGTVPTSGTRQVTPQTTTVYTVTATGIGGTASASVTVSINGSSGSAPTATISATPTSINSGQSTTLTWSTSDATTVTIDQGIGTVAASGTRSVSPTAATVYTLTATGPSGAVTKSVTISVAVCNSVTETVNVLDDPSSGHASDIVSAFNYYQDKIYDSPPTSKYQSTWNYYSDKSREYLDGATVVEYTEKDGSVSNQVVANWHYVQLPGCDLAPASDPCHSLNLEPFVTGPGGTDFEYWGACSLVRTAAAYFNDNSQSSTCNTVQKTVTTSSCSGSAPTATISANPTNTISGMSVTLTWSTTNATAISIDQGIGTVASSGTRTVSPTATTVYTITATGAGGTATASATVTLGGGGISPPITGPQNPDPVFYYKGIRLDHVTGRMPCGDSYTFTVENYAANKIWFTQTRNGVVNNTGAAWGIPFDYTTVCNQDEGSYKTDVYDYTTGQKGALLGSVWLTIDVKDATPPIISNIVISPIKDTSATIQWTTNEPATSMVSYGTTSSLGKMTPLNKNLVISHSVTITGLTPSTKYYVKVMSQDSAGNPASASDEFFTSSTSEQPSNAPQPVISVFTPSGWLVTNSVTCNQRYELKVNNFSDTKIWFIQTKNGQPNYDGPLTVPAEGSLACNRDEGVYKSEVYSMLAGAKGTLLGTVDLTVLSVSGISAPSVTGLKIGYISPTTLYTGDSYVSISGAGFTQSVTVTSNNPYLTVKSASANTEGTFIQAVVNVAAGATGPAKIIISQNTSQVSADVTMAAPPANAPSVSSATAAPSTQDNAVVTVTGQNLQNTVSVATVGSPNIVVTGFTALSNTQLQVNLTVMNFNPTIFGFIHRAYAAPITLDPDLLSLDITTRDPITDELLNTLTPIDKSTIYTAANVDPNSIVQPGAETPQPDNPATPPKGNLFETGFGTICSQEIGIATCIRQIYLLSLGLGALIAMLMIVLAGYRYMTAGGNAQQVESAKDAFTSAFIGLIIIFVAFILLYLINPDLVKFQPLSVLWTRLL